MQFDVWTKGVVTLETECLVLGIFDEGELSEEATAVDTAAGEQCDDGNTVSEVSCPYNQGSCTPCNATCTAVLSLRGPYCGDGVRNGPEACDDGNTVTETTCPNGQGSCSTCGSTCTTVFHSLGVAAVAAYVVWVDRLQIPPEEAALAKRFPVAFPEHARRVRRWL